MTGVAGSDTEGRLRYFRPWAATPPLASGFQHLLFLVAMAALLAHFLAYVIPQERQSVPSDAPVVMTHTHTHTLTQTQTKTTQTLPKRKGSFEGKK